MIRADRGGTVQTAVQATFIHTALVAYAADPTSGGTQNDVPDAHVGVEHPGTDAAEPRATTPVVKAEGGDRGTEGSQGAAPALRRAARRMPCERARVVL